MKTKFYFGMAVIALLTSCESLLTEEIVVSIDDKTPEVTFSATIETGNTTRTALSDRPTGAGYYSLYWTKGDAISVSDGENTAIFTTESDKSSIGEFTRKQGTIDGEATCYTAFYPSDITADRMWLSDKQKYVADNVENFPMYAISNTKDLKFKNLCGIISLNLRNRETGSVEVSSISLSADNAGMSGSFTIGEDGEAVVNGYGGVVLSCESAVPLDNSETSFNIIVPKGDYNPLRIKITDAEGKEVNLVSEGKIHVSRSGMTRITLTLGSSSFDSSLETIPITESDVEFTDR